MQKADDASFVARRRASAGAKLHMRERILASVASLAGDALVVVSPETGDVEFANIGAETKFGVPQAPEQQFRISRLTPELSDASWTNWLSTIGIGASATRLNVEIIDQNANKCPVDMVATRVRDGKNTYAVIRIIDNADRARTVRELQERARHLAIANRELEQFASVVAHDLRAPLRHLSQFAEFLRAELGSNASPPAQEYLRIIQSSATNMSGMVEHLLDYARIGANAARLSTLRIEDCVDHAVELLRAEISATNAVIDIGRLQPVNGDRILLGRLFQNLIANSIKYSRTDITPKIAVSATSNGKYVRISVSDNGIGIDPVHKHEIFKMFSRLHSDREYSGHGMGLAICKRVCEIHGGSIDLDEKPAEGARFIIKLPKPKPSASLEIDCR